jgi:hypothetical protein
MGPIASLEVYAKTERERKKILALAGMPTSDIPVRSDAGSNTLTKCTPVSLRHVIKQPELKTDNF